MTNNKLTITKLRPHNSTYRIAALAALVLVIAGAKSEPSAALPLISSKLNSSHAAIADSTLLAQIVHRYRASSDAQPAIAVALNDIHSLLTTPKDDGAGPASESPPLSIRTELRTRRTFAQARPEIHFTDGLPSGTKKLVRPGVPAITVVTERVTLWNALVVNRQVISRALVQRARPGLMFAGPPRNVAEAMAATGAHKLVAVFAMVATAYTADTAQAVPTGVTATGMPAHYGVVAVDPSVIRLGSRVYVEGYGTAIAADTGGAIRGNRIDLCMDSYQRALSWGRQPVKVYVIRE